MLHILPLTGEQIRKGILSQIANALDVASIESARAVTEQGLRGEKEEMLILFGIVKTRTFKMCSI